RRSTVRRDGIRLLMSDDLVYDWNDADGTKARLLPPNASFLDETLRDGLQNPSVVDPSIEDKIELLHRMNALAIHAATVGLPSAGPRAFEHVLRLCQEAARTKMKMRIACSGRTVLADVDAIIEVSQRAGIAVDAYTFIGSSPIRQFAESWDVAFIAKQ